MDATTKVLLGILIVGLALLYVLIFVPSKPEYRAVIVTEEFTAAVLPFTDKSDYSRYSGRDLGSVATSVVEAQLAGYPGITLVDREELHRILEEQRLCAQGLCDPDTAIEIGQLTGAEKLIMGEIINFSYTNKQTTTPEMVQLYPPKFEDVPATEHAVSISVQAIIVDTTTGEILFGDVINVQDTVTVKNREGGFSFNDLVDRVLQQAAQRIADHISAQASKTFRYDLYESVRKKGEGWEGKPAERVPAQAPIYVVLYFERLDQGDEIEVRWIDPEGEVYQRQTIEYLRSKWAKLEFTPPAKPGRWTMELYFKGLPKPVGKLYFRVLAPSTSALPLRGLRWASSPLQGAGWL